MLNALIFLLLVGIGFGIRKFILAHKRSLTLTVENSSVSAGEPITCVVVLENQKMIQSNEISLTLIGVRPVREQGKGLVKKEVHRSKHVVAGIKTYQPKNRSEFRMDVPTPAREQKKTSKSSASAFGLATAMRWAIVPCLASYTTI